MDFFKNRKFKETIVLISSIFLGMAFGIFLVLILKAIVNTYLSPVDEFMRTIFVVVTIVFGFFVELILHEMGHMVFGFLSGYEFSSFRILSFMIIRKDGKFSFRRFSLPGTAGQCLMIPPMKEGNDFPVVLYNLGGVIFNAVTGILCFVIAYCMKDAKITSLIWSAVGLIAIIMAVTNGIPIHSSIDNDGLNAMVLKKNADARRCLKVLLNVNSDLIQGKRMKDVPETYFTGDVSSLETTLGCSVAVQSCVREIDKHNFVMAQEKIEYLLKNANEMNFIDRSSITCELIWMLLLQGKKEEASSYMTKNIHSFIKSMRSFPSIVRLQYAWARYYDQQEVDAEQHKKHFYKLLNTYPYAGEVKGEKELFEITEKGEWNGTQSVSEDGNANNE